MRMGVNTITTLVEQKKARLVVIACDVDPIEVGNSDLLNSSILFSKYFKFELIH